MSLRGNERRIALPTELVRTPPLIERKDITMTTPLRTRVKRSEDASSIEQQRVGWAIYGKKNVTLNEFEK